MFTAIVLMALVAADVGPLCGVLREFVPLRHRIAVQGARSALKDSVQPVKGSAGMSRAEALAGWLSGCWEMTRGNRRVTEQWTTPDGGTLLGIGRTVENGRTVEYEFLLIREGKQGLEYVAKPSGQAEAVFTLVKSSTSQIVFENPQHDFPTRISYTREGNALTARIEGAPGGKPRAFDFAYRAVACPASAR